MKTQASYIFRVLILLVILFITACNSNEGKKVKERPRPNILLIVADDLGYSDLSPFGGEINTPTLDRLAQEGHAFSNFHVLPTCSPTRSALLSGNDNHIAGLGVMHEWIYPEIVNLPGYIGHLSDQVATIPEILDEAGYNTYMSGKWHLGEDDDQSPYARGFKETFTLVNGGGSHWADMKPLSLPQTMIYRKNGKRIEKLPKDFYSTKNYTDSIIHFINKNINDGKPFFAYLSYTAPHDPLHAPEKYIKKYKGHYDMGWDSLRIQRLRALKEKGLISTDVNKMTTNRMVRNWASLDDEMKDELARDMEVYAAMVDYLDMSINRLFQYLKENMLWDNTLIVFMSDNGANGAPATAYPGNLDGEYLGSFDNETENRGLQNSFIEMGSGWAQASSSPFRMYKSFTTQGGIKSPMIVKAPGSTGGGKWNRSFLHVTDILPTFLEASGAIYPAEVQGRSVKAPIGKSFMPIILGESASIHENEGMGYELFEMKAYIKGDWKVLRMPVPFGSGNWELFNLKNDPGEMNDLSAEHPDKKAELLKAFEKYLTRNEVFDHKGRFDIMYRKAYGVE